MQASLNEQILITNTDPEFQEFIDLHVAIKFIVNFLNTLQNDNPPFIDKSIFYKDYVDSLNMSENIKALSKASFSFIFKVFCVHYGYRTVQINTRGRKKVIYLKRLNY